MKTPALIEGLYEKPFTYEQEGTRIVDKNNNWVLDIRGWGRIQNLYPGENIMNLDSKAATVQDAFGMYVCDLLNIELLMKTGRIIYAIGLALIILSGIIWGFREVWPGIILFVVVILAVEIITPIVIKKRLKK